MASSSGGTIAVDRPLRPLYWCWLIRLLVRRLLSILSRILLSAHKREIGRYARGEVASFSGLRIGIILAVFQSSG